MLLTLSSRPPYRAILPVMIVDSNGTFAIARSGEDLIQMNHPRLAELKILSIGITATSTTSIATVLG